MLPLPRDNLSTLLLSARAGEILTVLSPLSCARCVLYTITVLSPLSCARYLRHTFPTKYDTMLSELFERSVRRLFGVCSTVSHGHGLGYTRAHILVIVSLLFVAGRKGRDSSFSLHHPSSGLTHTGLGSLQQSRIGHRHLCGLTAEDRMNSDKTSTNIESETTRTYRDHVVQILPHLPCQQRQSDASSSRPIPAATLFLAASRGLDPLRRRYAPASPRPIRTPNEMIPPLAVPEGSQACW